MKNFLIATEHWVRHM